MNKLYPSRINWHNEPSTETPIDEINLNKMDKFCDDIDNRVIEMDSRVTDLEDIEPTVLGYVTRAENAASDSEAYAVGKRNGSDVPSTDPTYHNNAKYYSEQAGTSATNAATSETNAGTSESNAATSASNAEAYAVGQRNGTDVPSSDPTYHNNSKFYAQEAGNSANAAATSESNALASENNAAISETYAATSESNAEAWAIGERMGVPVNYDDPTYHNNSKWFSQQSANSAASADSSATDALEYRNLSESYAVGTYGVVREGDATDNSKYYSQLSAQSATEAGDILDEIKGYQGMIIPDLYLDAENGILYVEDLTGKTVDFAFDEDECALYWGFVVTP